MIRASRSLVCGCSLSALLACTSPPPRYPQRRVDVCDALCAHAQACGSDGFDCSQRCKFDGDWEPVYQRRAYVDAFTRCVREAPCRSKALTDCRRSAREGITATPATIAFCAKRLEKDSACGIATKADDCARDFEVLEDEVFPALERCFDEPCERYRRCILGIYANGPS